MVKVGIICKVYMYLLFHTTTHISVSKEYDIRNGLAIVINQDRICITFLFMKTGILSNLIFYNQILYIYYHWF